MKMDSQPKLPISTPFLQQRLLRLRSRDDEEEDREDQQLLSGARQQHQYGQHQHQYGQHQHQYGQHQQLHNQDQHSPTIGDSESHVRKYKADTFKLKI